MYPTRWPTKSQITWKYIKAEELDLSYTVALPKNEADLLFEELEKTLTYFTGDLANVKVFGKIHPIPRQQVAYGDEGITYKYSGVTVPTLPWPKPVLILRQYLEDITGVLYDFVLVNKYRNGSDHMGEHRDNEPELDPDFPIASITFGQKRTFVLRHRDSRKSGPNKKIIPPVKIDLEHGSILLMNPPTNQYWYHSIPAKKSLMSSRINLTFRKYKRV